MLQARIGRLESGARRVVLAASVLGETFWQGGVAAILGLPRSSPTVAEGLAVAMEAELVQPHASSQFANDREYGFRHALVRDAAYSLLVPADLAAGHRLAAEFLEQSGESDAAVLAEHFERSGDKQRAASSYLRASESRMERGNLLGALRTIGRGVRCEPSPEQLGQLRSLESFALLWLSRYEHLGEAAELALAHLRPGSLGWCRATAPAFHAAMIGGRFERAYALVSLILAADPDANARAIFLQSILTMQSIMVGSVPAPLLQAVQQKSEAIMARAEATDPTLRRYVNGGQGLVALYREPCPWSALLNFVKNLELAAQTGDERLDLTMRTGYIELAWLDLGDVEGARQRLLSLETRLEQGQEAVAVGFWRCVLAQVLCEADDATGWPRAAGLVAPLLADAGGHTLFIALAQCVMARLSLLRGELAAAEAQARAAMQFFPLIPTLVSQAAAVQIHALIGLGSLPAAVAVAEQALAAIAALRGIGCNEVEVRLAASLAFHAQGALDRAHAELTETLRQIQLRADDITDPFWRSSYLTRNRYCVRAQALAERWGLATRVCQDYFAV